jgi:hypothetical protein
MPGGCNNHFNKHDADQHNHEYHHDIQLDLIHQLNYNNYNDYNDYNNYNNDNIHQHLVINHVNNYNVNHIDNFDINNFNNSRLHCESGVPGRFGFAE